MVSKKTRRYRYTVHPRAPRHLPWNSQAQRPRLQRASERQLPDRANENATRSRCPGPAARSFPAPHAHRTHERSHDPRPSLFLSLTTTPLTGAAGVKRRAPVPRRRPAGTCMAGRAGQRLERGASCSGSRLPRHSRNRPATGWSSSLLILTRALFRCVNF